MRVFPSPIYACDDEYDEWGEEMQKKERREGAV
jgi:hypothetical protein